MREYRTQQKIDKKDAEELKKIYNQYLDKRKEVMKNTHFKVEGVFVFGDVISKDSNPPEQLLKLKNFLAKTL